MNHRVVFDCCCCCRTVYDQPSPPSYEKTRAVIPSPKWNSSNSNSSSSRTIEEGPQTNYSSLVLVAPLKPTTTTSQWRWGREEEKEKERTNDTQRTKKQSNLSGARLFHPNCISARPVVRLDQYSNLHPPTLSSPGPLHPTHPPPKCHTEHDDKARKEGKKKTNQPTFALLSVATRTDGPSERASVQPTD